MHICKLINQAAAQPTPRPLFSAELIPPKKGGDWQAICREVAQLKAAGVNWMSVTSHIHERGIEVVNDKPVVRVKKKRLDTNALCIGFKEKLGIEVMPHIICNGFTQDETEDALANLDFFGIENILALRGDPLVGQLPFYVEELRHNYAADLVAQIAAMNQGHYIAEIENAHPTKFCIGVAGYPEKHFEATTVKADLKHLKHKVEAGADFIVTQMFYDNEAYYRFVEAARAIGITVPIIPGIKPVYKLAHITTLPDIFHIGVPEDLRKCLAKYNQPADIRRAGIEYTITQCRDLLDHGIPYIHFFTLSQSNATVEVLRAIT